MMDAPTKLETALVQELLAIINPVEVGAAFDIPSSADLCSSMELFLPRVLRVRNSEWDTESIDGFFFAQASKVGPTSASLAGTCILISDQSLTPFRFDVEVASSGDRLAAYRVRVGEPGTGPLGISGPPYGSKGATSLLFGLLDRIDQVRWIYDVVGPTP